MVIDGNLYLYNSAINVIIRNAVIDIFDIFKDYQQSVFMAVNKDLVDKIDCRQYNIIFVTTTKILYLLTLTSVRKF